MEDVGAIEDEEGFGVVCLEEDFGTVCLGSAVDCDFGGLDRIVVCVDIGLDDATGERTEGEDQKK